VRDERGEGFEGEIEGKIVAGVVELDEGEVGLELDAVHAIEPGQEVVVFGVLDGGGTMGGLDLEEFELGEFVWEADAEEEEQGGVARVGEGGAGEQRGVVGDGPLVKGAIGANLEAAGADAAQDGAGAGEVFAGEGGGVGHERGIKGVKGGRSDWWSGVFLDQAASMRRTQSGPSSRISQVGMG
jgi:hypothetical protein